MHRKLFFIIVVLLAAYATAPSQAAIVFGQVRDFDTSLPLTGVQVRLNVTNASFEQTVATDGDGNYQLDVPAGNVDIEVTYTGYFSLAYGFSVDTEPDEEDFDLSTMNFIHGTVRDAVTGAPLAHHPIGFIHVPGTWSNTNVGTSAFSAADGTYSLAVPPGQYGVCAGAWRDDYLSVCYDQMLIGADGIPKYTVLTIAAGEEIDSIDFSLPLGTSISGHMVDTYFHVPIQDFPMWLRLYSQSGDRLADFTVAPGAGGYYSISGIAPGNYYLEAGNTAYGISAAPNIVYTTRLYGGAECAPPDGFDHACTFAGASLVTVTTSGATGIDFSLFPGYVATGRVTDSASGAGIADATVQTCDSGGFTFFATTGLARTDANGYYAVGHAVGLGTYIVASTPSGHFLPMIWNQHSVSNFVDCFTTGVYVGDSLSFTAPDQVIENVNFALDVGASASGHITASDQSNAPISASVGAYTSDGTYVTRVASVSTDFNGAFTLGQLPPGTYYIGAFFGTYFDARVSCVLYPAAACASAASPTVAELSNAIPIILTSGKQTSGIDIGLRVDLFHNGFD